MAEPMSTMKSLESASSPEEGYAAWNMPVDPSWMSSDDSDKTFQENIMKVFYEESAYHLPHDVMEPDIEYDTDASITDTEDSETDEESQNDSVDSLGIEVIKSKISQILNKSSQGGNIAVGGLYPSLPPMAGISITGYGPVAVPVTATTVEELKRHFEQAPYGLGEDTLLDLEVRNSWQMGPQKFQINNSAFKQKIEELVIDVKKSLGCEDVPVESKLYKLLLYEPGGHFKPHRDTEKDDGMFATLIIQLPSVFTGGDLIVTHNEQKEILKFSQEGSSYSCVFAAHYADCQHELTEVTSGYRLALIYSLCWQGIGSVPSARQLNQSSTKLTKFLKLFSSVSSTSPYLVWQLAHLYSKNSLEKFGTEAMKGADRHILDAIMLANRDLDDDDKLELAFLRASKQDEEYGECSKKGYGGGSFYGRSNHEDEENDCFEFIDESECRLNIESTFPIGSNIVVPKFNLNELLASVLNNSLSSFHFWGEGESDGCSGPSGNEGATRSMWYHRCFLVMWKKSETAKIRYANDFKGSIQHIDSLKENQDQAKKELDSFLPYCQENNKLIEQKDDSCVNLLLKVVSSFADPCYLTKTLRLIGGSVVTVELLQDLQKAVNKFSWEILQPEIENIFKNVPDNESGLQNIIKCFKLKYNNPTDLKLSLFKEMEKRCLNAVVGVVKKDLITIWKAVQEYEKVLVVEKRSSDVDKKSSDAEVVEVSSSDSEIGEFEDGLDDELMGDSQDRERLKNMNEKEREEEIFNRAEKREMLKKRYEMEKKLKLQKESNKEEAKVNKILDKKQASRDMSDGDGDSNALLQKMVDELITWSDLETFLWKVVNAFPDQNDVKNDVFFKGVVHKFLAFSGSNIGKSSLFAESYMNLLAYLSHSCQDEASSGLLLTEFKRRIDSGNIGELDWQTILRLHKTVLKYVAVFNYSKDDDMEKEMLQKIVSSIRKPSSIIRFMDQPQLQNLGGELFLLKQLAKQFLALAETKKINSSDVVDYVNILVKVNLEESMMELSVQLQKSPYVEDLDEYCSKILEIQPFPSPLSSLIHTRLNQLQSQVSNRKPHIFEDRQELTAFQKSKVKREIKKLQSLLPKIEKPKLPKKAELDMSTKAGNLDPSDQQIVRKRVNVGKTFPNQEKVNVVKTFPHQEKVDVGKTFSIPDKAPSFPGKESLQGKVQPAQPFRAQPLISDMFTLSHYTDSKTSKKVIPCTVTNGSQNLEIGEHREAALRNQIKKEPYSVTCELNSPLKKKSKIEINDIKENSAG